MPEILASLRQMKTIQEPTTRSGLTLMQDFSCPEKVRGVRCDVYSYAQNVGRSAQMRDMLSRMFVKDRRVGTSEPIHVRVDLPDKREVGSSTLPRPINLRP